MMWLARIGLALTLTLSGVLAVPAPAHADSSVTNCWEYPYTRAMWHQEQWDYWAMDYIPYTATGSPCHDINVGFAPWTGNCFNVRTRFFPTSGGNYANAWRWHCTPGWTVVATNVAEHTRFRLEIYGSSLPTGWNYTYIYT
jgi:hypothetical protein